MDGMGKSGLPESLAALARAIRERSISPVEAVETCLERIEADETNAFITVTSERAMEQAKEVEREILAGEHRGPLHGVPVALKDLIYTEGVRTTMASAFFEDHVPDESATVARKLEEAGAVLVGKTNTHEFAYGPTGDRSFFGPTRNPHDHARITGGSSGGSGAAVATNLCYAAVGSDTGGSIRIPAALCGIVGMKPTFGRVSKHGVFPLSWTLDHVGPITRHVEDNALILNALAGHDPRDFYSVDLPSEDFTRDLRLGVRGTVIGIPRDFYFEHVEEGIEARVREVAEVFRSLGAEVREVAIPNAWETLKAQRLTLASEAYAVHEERLKTEPERFDDQGLERLLNGEKLEAYRYANAQQRKLRSREEFADVLESVDVILTPTVPIPATEIGQRQTNIHGYEEAVYSALTRLTGPTNMNGLPSLSIPCGVTTTGLPAGAQLIGRPLDEATLYRFGHAYEEAAP
ncbi:MAG: amidase [Actinomycetota bacterium]|jgi:aspartyl-tRNA(Asn)/glutamyl-tRNA(Gln) amidotransferase subunit A|nr:amidase [Actinomycetota bacterium]MDQ3567081.1 amidase [Actinomycetota bacterium]